MNAIKEVIVEKRMDLFGQLQYGISKFCLAPTEFCRNRTCMSCPYGQEKADNLNAMGDLFLLMKEKNVSIKEIKNYVAMI